MRTAVMTDSNSGITPEEGIKIGVYSLPMPVIIEGKVHFEGKDITHEQFYEAVVSDREVTSSMPSPGDVLDLWDRLLGEEGYDEVVYIPLSSGLSNSCYSARQLAEDYEGKVQVVDDHRISVTMRQSVLDAKYMADQGFSAEAIKEALEKNAYNSVIFLTVEDLKYLKRGGRISPAAATLGTVLNIKPILTTTGGKFEALEKVRGMKKSVSKLLDYAEEYTEKMLKEYPVEKIRIGAAGSFQKQEDADEWFSMVKERFSQITHIYYDPLSLSVGCHVGPDAVGIGISVILREKE